MSVTIEPTVTPAPKPEWNAITAYIYSPPTTRKPVLSETAPSWMGSGYTHVATVTIPSSADCERRAKVEGAKERVLFAAEQWVRALDAACGDKLIQEVKALWKIEAEQETP